MARKKKTTDSIAGDETPWASSSRRVGHSARQDVPSTPSTPRVSSKPAPAASKTLCCSSSSRIRRALVAPPLLALVLVPVVLAFVNMRALRRHKAAAAAGMTVASAQGAAASSIASALHINERPWGTNPPRWCKELIANPQERPRTSAIYDCRRGRFGAVCEDGTPRFFSQYNQDIWTWNSHFKHLKRRGVYVDIATNEPVRISNTYFYDACLQWRGLCVEAHPGYINLIKRMRSCAITPACVGEKEGNVTFVLDAGGSGVLETNKNAAAVAKKDRISVRCVKTKDAIMAAGITVIDLLSLDVEGYELNVLKGIDWTKTRINVIVIESLSEETKALLHGLGYTRANQPQTGEEKKKPGNIFSDFVYLHPDVVWGKPV